MKKWKQTAGFTLVELIVVIAILGILAGVGTVGYSGYIKKANMAADQQIITGVKNALSLAAVSPNSGLMNGDSLVLEYGKDAVASSDAVQNAVVAAFGGTWDTLKSGPLKLKYDNWQQETEGGQIAADYTDSSFYNNEDTLLTQVQTLSSVLSSVAQTSPTAIGSSFSSYLTGERLDPSNTTVAGNGAVLYVANQASAMNDTAKTTFESGLNKYIIQGNLSQGISDLTSSTSSAAAAAASVYAMMAAYCQFANDNGNSEPLTALNNLTAGMTTTDIRETQDVIDLIGSNYNTIMRAGMIGTDDTAKKNQALWMEYCTGVDKDQALKYMNGEMSSDEWNQAISENQSNSRFSKDTDAYLSAMKAINNNKELIKDNIEKTDCYTDGTMKTEMTNYLQNNSGQVTVMVQISGANIQVVSNLDS